MHLAIPGTRLSVWLDAGQRALARVRWVLVGNIAFAVLVLLALVMYGSRIYCGQIVAWGPDKMIQVATAHTLARGMGVGYRIPDSNDLARNYFRPVFEWPVGYSLVFAALL